MSTINLKRSAFDNATETIEVTENTAIREALPELDYANALIAVNGFIADENYILHGNDICTIRLFPKGAPGGSKIEIALGILTLGVYTLTDAIISGVTGKTIGQHLRDWLVSDIYNANDYGETESIPQLGGAKNQSNRNKPIPLVLGKHLYTPMYIGSPYAEISGEDGEDQYYNALYLLGWGQLQVSDIKLGPVSGLVKNTAGKTEGTLSYNDDPNFCDPSFADNNPQLELRQGVNPNRTDGEVGLYPQKVVEERLSIELMNAEGKSPLEVIRFSAKNPQKVQIEFTFNNGLVSYNDDGEKKDASVDITVEWRESTADQWKEFGRIGTNGGLSPTQYNTATHTTTITRKKPKVMRFTAERSFTYAEAGGAVNRTLELRIVRASEQPTDTSRTADTVYLTAIRTWCFDNEATEANNGQMVPQAPIIQKYRDKTARLGFRIKASDNLQGTIDALNCIVQSYARVWDGSGWDGPEVPTNNPASIALKVLQSPALGNNSYPDSMLDLDSFGEFYQWCEERKYSCNGVLTTEKRVDDLLNIVLSTGRGMRILNGNRYAVLIDKPRDNPVMILNSQNVLEATNQKSFEDLPDGFSIKFINELDGYQETEVNVMADGSAQPGPLSKIESIEMPFVTDHEQIVKNGWYQLACRYLRPEIWYRKLSVDGYLVGIGDMVEVQDDTIVVGIGEGGCIIRLDIENNVITKIYTDGEFEVADMNKTYGIKIMQFDGVNQGKVRTIQVPISAPGIHSSFIVAIPLNADAPIPHVGDLIAFGVYDRITTQALCFGKKDNGDGTFDVTLIPYQEGVYTTDTEREIPPYNANITTPQSIGPLHEIPPTTVTKSDVFEIVQQIEITGTAAVVYDLRPSVNVIKRDNHGNNDPDAVSCAQVKIEGNKLPEPSYKDLSYITSADNTPFKYTGPITVGGWDWIEFILSDGGIELDRERIPVLRNGDAAVVYELVPSVNVISRAQDGATLEPRTIDCHQQSTTGAAQAQPSNKVIKYRTSLNSDEKIFAGPMDIDPRWEWIEFLLYDGDTLLDRKRVPVLDSGSSFVFVHLQRDSKALACDEDGFPVDGALSFTNQATLYRGNEKLSPDTDGEIRWELEGAPEGMGIDAEGLITVSPWTIFNDHNEILVVAVFDEKRYETLFDIVKIYSGKSPIIIDIDNESRQIACLYDGNYKPGQLPLEIQATLYRGHDAVTDESEYRYVLYHSASKDILCFPGSGQDLFEPYLGVDVSYPSTPLDPAIMWSLEDEPHGVEINRYGTVTVSADAALDVFNIIIVKAVYRGNEYTKILQITKVLDGMEGEDGQPGQYTDYMFAKNTSVSTAPSYTANADSPGSNWHDTPPTINENEYLWMTESDWRGTQRLTTWSAPVRISGPAGHDGGYYEPRYRRSATRPATPTGNSPSGWFTDPAGASGADHLWMTCGLKTAEGVLQGTWSQPVQISGENGAQGDPAPRYLGKAKTPGGSTGIVTIWDNANSSREVQAHLGDWVAYVGTDQTGASIWKNGMCIRWNGTAWEQIPVVTDGDFESNPYIHALLDLTEGSPKGTFMSILVRDLIAKTAMIERIFSHKLKIQKIDNDEGAIYGGGYNENGNPTGGPGFYLGTDGRLKAVDGYFEGELAARSVKVTGSISSGTAYLLRANNNLSIIDSYGQSWIAATIEAVTKEIKTLATGTCTIRLRFPRVASASMNNRNMGFFKLSVNDIPISVSTSTPGINYDAGDKWFAYNTDVNIDIPNISLPNQVNHIKLYGEPSSSGNMGSYGFYNTIFELRCAQDPGFLSVLG